MMLLAFQNGTRPSTDHSSVVAGSGTNAGNILRSKRKLFFRT